mmetsp:Transcript_32419/g.74092  ORF Transcript_32419/g.74092 Transcript_32419/m.74092 type:complete len:1006 (-) Transcript_32419:233-3250(-)
METAPARTEKECLVLPDSLSEEQRLACVALTYKAVKLTLDAKKTLTEEQRKGLLDAVDRVLTAKPEPGCLAQYPLALCVWLRNKKELGNRLVPTALLAICAGKEATRPFVRRAASEVLKIPTDLTEFLCEFDETFATKEGGAVTKRPTCMKKVAADLVNNIPAFQAAKYSTVNKIKRVKSQLKAAKEKLAGFTGDTLPDAGGFAPSRRNNATREVHQKKAEQAVKELQAKLKKLHAGDLRNVIKHSHAGKNHEVIMGIMHRRYPATKEAFQESGLPGEFDESRANDRMILEAPPTWDRELSEKGNVPTTWAALLTSKDAKGRYTMPYMAMLRNLRNILLMGFTPSFLRKHVLSRLTDLRQIQGSGQTPISLSHTWTVLSKEFDEKKLQELQEQSTNGIRDIMAYKCLLRKIRGPILGTSDKHIGIIGDFLGEAVWEPCGLKKQGGCFLTSCRVLMRGGQVLAKGKGKGKAKGKKEPVGQEEGGQKTEKWLPVPLHPPTCELMEELKSTFDEAIQAAARCGVEPMSFEGDGPAILWMDLSNPPLDTNATMVPMADAGGDQLTSADEAKFKQVIKRFKIEKGEDAVYTKPGVELELDEVTTHRNLNLELRYFAQSYIDYNVQAYDWAGSTIWNSTYSRVEIKNSAGVNCVVHCRDICANPAPDVPALRTCHIDLDGLDPSVFAMMITSQNFSGTRPEDVAIALRECHAGGASKLQGNHEPHDCDGRCILAQDTGKGLKEGGTVVYGCLFRDVNDPDTWKFRNTLDFSLQQETRVAAQVQDAAGAIFKKIFQDKALESIMDANRVGYVRLCQLNLALTPTPAELKKAPTAAKPVLVFLSGIPKRETEPMAVKLELTGRYVEDLETVKEAKKRFSAKAVDSNIALEKVLEAAGLGSSESATPRVIIRVANNSHTPTEVLAALRKKARRAFPYGTVDGRGHCLDAFESLPDVSNSALVPGQVESSVSLLSRLLQAGDEKRSSSEMFLKYVSSFMPKAKASEPMDASEVPA